MSIDLSLENIWRSYYRFKAGKHLSADILCFNYYLEKNLYNLFVDLNNGLYRHGNYRYFTVCDNKKRRIAVAHIRDRVVHRLVYDYLVSIYDRIFIYDVWSNRKSKGLDACIDRTQQLLKNSQKCFVWRADIKKCFDSIDQRKLLEILKIRIKNDKDWFLLKKIIGSYGLAEKGLPIGNLTSQILSNIYLNEFDRYIKHQLRLQAYVRYGDDFIIIEKGENKLKEIRVNAIHFLQKELGLELNRKNDIIIKAKRGLNFLGMKIYPLYRKLSGRNITRIRRRLSTANLASYYGLVKNNQLNLLKEIDWRILEYID